MSRQQKSSSPIPDGPQLRSVLIRAPSSFGEDALLSAPPPTAKFAAGPKFAPSVPSTSSATVTPRNATWTVSKSDLRALPDLYPLERTHSHIDDVPVQEVADRISECLRTESIAAVFNEDKAMVLAETCDHIRFCIRLFLDPEERIVVEVQRRTGCCFLYHQASKAIIRAAKGLPHQPLPKLELPDCVKQLEGADGEIEMKEDLEIAAGLLKKDRYDAHLLGMEGLVQITNMSTSNCSVAAARAILFHSQVLDTILSLIESWAMHQHNTNEVAFRDMDDDYLAQMHRNALAVLANCLQALDAANELDSVVAHSERLVTDNLLQGLVRELAAAEQRPHDACEAAKCLKTLLKASDDTKTRLEQMDCAQALKVAHAEGQCSHCRLEEESKKLQDVFY